MDATEQKRKEMGKNVNYLIYDKTVETVNKRRNAVVMFNMA